MGAEAAVGFVAFAKQSGPNVIVDVFVAVSNASDKFISVQSLNSTTTLPGGFAQRAGLATKTWKPDTAGFTSTRNTSDDSFMTAGTFSGGAYGGEFYASSNSNANPNFTGTSWNATPSSPAATTIPANAGWYTSDSTSIDNRAESLVGMAGIRIDGSDGTSSTGGTTSTAVYGIWVSHLVFKDTTVDTAMTGLTWSGRVSMHMPGGGFFSAISYQSTADTDGDGVTDLHDYCPTLPGSPTCNGCPPDLCCAGDISHNGRVDGIDLGMLLAHWGPCTSDCIADITGDGLVDGADLGILLHDWAHCPG
jgi:hypothetical protein